jgi:hypothetical protein
VDPMPGDDGGLGAGFEGHGVLLIPYSEGF